MATGFPRRVRLTTVADYKNVFSDGRRAATAALVLLYRDNGLDEARLGLAISKKHVKYAVQRNTVKRVVREYFRLHRDEVAGRDIVVLSRHALAQSDRAEVRRQLEQLWGKLNKPSAG